MALAYKVRSTNITAEESLVMLKNLTKTAISFICYLRGVFPESYFCEKTLSGTKVKSLLPRDDGSKRILQWLEKGVFEALRLGYLKVLSLGFHADREERCFIESYEFKVTYPATKGHPSFSVTQRSTAGDGSTKETVVADMARLLQTLIVSTSTLKPLPESRFISMKVLYYEEITPAGYHPKFFHEVEQTIKELFIKRQLLKLQVGSLQTPHHSMSMRVVAHHDHFEDLRLAQAAQEANVDDSQSIEETQMDDDDEGEEEGAARSGNRDALGQVLSTSVNVRDARPLQAERPPTDVALRRVEEILQRPSPSADELVYLRVLLHAFGGEATAPARLGKLLSLGHPQLHGLLEQLQREGFVRPTAGRRGWAANVTAETGAAVRALLARPDAAQLGQAPVRARAAAALDDRSNSTQNEAGKKRALASSQLHSEGVVGRPKRQCH